MTTVRPTRRTPEAGLPSLLPYFVYDDGVDPQAGVFVNQDLSLGLVWELAPVEAETIGDPALGDISLRLESLLRSLPHEEAALQVILVSGTRPSATLRRWQNATDGAAAEIIKHLTRARVQAIATGRWEDTTDVFVGRSIRVFLTLRLLSTLRGWSLLDALAATVTNAHIVDRLRRFLADERQRLETIARAIERSLTQACVGHARLGPDQVVGLLYELLNPATSRRVSHPPRYREDMPIADLVARSPLDFDPLTGTLALDGTFGAVLSVTQLPLVTRAGEIWRDAAKHPAGAADEIVCTYNVWIPDPNKVQSALKWSQFLSFRHRATTSSGINAEASVIHDDVEQIQHEIAREGRQVAKAQILFVVRETTPERLQQKCAELQSRFSALSYEITREDAYALGLFLQSLPLAFDPAADHGTRRARTLTTLNLAHLLPAYAPWRGTTTPDLLLQNRLGEPATLSFFDTDGAAHGLVLGRSGGGKSFLINHLIFSVLRRGARVFIVDKGAGDREGSYAKIVRLLGGLYVRLDADHVRSLNPFGRVTEFGDRQNVLSNNRKIFLTLLVGRMITRGTRELTTEERDLVGQAIQSVYVERLDRRSAEAILLSDVKAHLDRLAPSDPLAGRLARALDIWTGQGAYAKFFDRPCEFEQDLPPVVCFEIADNEGWNEVATVVLMAVLHLVASVSSRERGRDKYLIIDEAWTLLKSPDTANFLVTVAKTYRKLRTALVLVTQQVADFQGPLGEVIKAEAQTRILCQQLPDTIDYTAQVLSLTDSQAQAFRTLQKRDGLYSEVLILAPRSCGIARYAPSSLEYWLATSSARDNEQLIALAGDLAARGVPDPERAALVEASVRFPRGLGAPAASGGA